MKKKAFPVVVKRGSVRVKIYLTPSHGCDSFTLSYYQDGVRKRPTFAAFETAKAEAEMVASKLSRTDADILTLTSADRAAYLRARQLLDPLQVSLETAAAQFAEARKQLVDVPLSQAVEFYLKRNPTEVERKRVVEVVQELLTAKERDGLSARYIQTLRYCLGKFAHAFQCDVGQVSGTDIDKWLRDSGLSPRSRNNLRNAVQTLFTFAEGRRYLAKGNDEMNVVRPVNDRDGAIEVFTPSELIEVLAGASERMIPFIVIGAFAGIRRAEIERLDWTEIRFEEGFIEIGASKAKTASRRLVPIVENLRQWLMQFRRETGPVVMCRNVTRELHAIAKHVNRARRGAWTNFNGIEPKQLQSAANNELIQVKSTALAKTKGEIPAGVKTAKQEGWTSFAWKSNALRHSFISYRVAETQNVAQVALEAGNSPQVIFRNYRELVRPVEAKAWFSITPDTMEAFKTGSSVTKD